MIVVNSLITNCFRKCSLCGDAQVPTGNQSIAGLNDLKSVIADLNGQNLILTDVETVDVQAGETIRVMDKLPDGWYELDEFPLVLTDYQVGDIIKVKDSYKEVKYDTVKYLEEIPNFNLWPDLIIYPLPDRVQGLARKIGERFVQLLPAERQLLDSHTKRGLPTFYTAETQLEHFSTQGKEYDYEVFIIHTDSVLSCHYRLTYLKKIPEYELNDKLYFSERLISIIEDGVCAKLCLRYKLIDIKPIFEEEFANAVRLLKRSNNGNRPMTYQEGGGSYLDSYYDGFSPREW